MDTTDKITYIRQHSIAGRIHRLSRLLNTLNEHRWASDGYDGVKSAHIQLLLNIDQEGTTNRLLAQRAGLTKQTMSRMVKDLQESGYVQVENNPNDSRAVNVSLTDRGNAFVHYLAGAVDDLNKALIQVVGSDNFTIFSNILKLILDFIERRQSQLNQAK